MLWTEYHQNTSTNRSFTETFKNVGSLLWCTRKTLCLHKNEKFFVELRISKKVRWRDIRLKQEPIRRPTLKERGTAEADKREPTRIHRFRRAGRGSLSPVFAAPVSAPDQYPEKPPPRWKRRSFMLLPYYADRWHFRDARPRLPRARQRAHERVNEPRIFYRLRCRFTRIAHTTPRPGRTRQKPWLPRLCPGGGRGLKRFRKYVHK